MSEDVPAYGSTEALERKARFNSLVDQLRAIVAGAAMFGSKEQKKIITQADKVLLALRRAMKGQILEQIAKREAVAKSQRRRRKAPRP